LFNFINRDHVYGLVIGAAFAGAVLFFAGCKTDKDADTADSAEETTTEETTTPTTPTTPTDTGEDTGPSDTGAST
jgi:hypothetical protein|tara:strand:+ start:882 stop:1106 length:225 start_codon:yes stop_codon:yes gene_type:complete